MRRVTTAAVEETWEAIKQLSPDEGYMLLARMAIEHPHVFDYLRSAGKDFLNQDARETMIYLGMVIWQIMQRTRRELPVTTRESLETAEHHNISILNYLEGESEEDIIATINLLLENYHQPHILRYIIEQVIEDDADALHLSMEGKGAMILSLKTALDCLAGEPVPT